MLTKVDGFVVCVVVTAGVGVTAAAEERQTPAACGGGPDRSECPIGTGQQGSVGLLVCPPSQTAGGADHKVTTSFTAP